jgi:murein DD-endopeptidase MepM/ murein hydrolase activator NlpD
MFDGGRIGEAIERLFPERQILLRTNGEIRFATLGRRPQMMIAACTLSLVGWLSYATIGIEIHRERLAERDTRIAEIAGAYDRLTDDMLSIHKRYEAITLDLESKHQFLSRVLEQRSGLETRLKELSGELRRTAGQRDYAEETGERLRSKINDLGDELDRALSTADHLEGNLNLVGNRLSEIRAHRDAAQEQVTNLNRTVSDLRTDLSDTTNANEKLKDALAASNRQIAMLTSERNQLAERNQQLGSEVEGLEARLSFLETTQSSLVARLHERTDDSIDSLEGAVRSTGLDLEKLLARAGVERNVGGPLIDFAGVQVVGGEIKAAIDKSSIASLEDRLEHWNTLNEVLEIIPFTAPVDHYRLTSSFGMRRDPYTKKRAFHGGIDLAGETRAKILSTAAGTVTYVGWRGPYGRVVEIDHGHGIVTRYGHLRKILVKKGQPVEFRQKIGLMGSSGRSTGTHVHYEIIFDGKHLDPLNFIKAGRYVYKQG